MVPVKKFRCSISAFKCSLGAPEHRKKEKMIKEVERVEKKLSNAGFVSKAPANVIEEEKAKGEKYKAVLAQIEERLAQMNK